MDKSIITFSANEQNLQKTGGIGCYASDTVSYIEAHFDLGDNWAGYDSIRAVWFNDYKTISTVLDSDGVCIVPHEVLVNRGKVMVNLVGSVLVSDELSDRLTTFPCEALKVSAKAKISGSETAAVTPSQFEQFVSIVISEVEKVTGMTAQAETLPAGSQATAHYENGILYLGIPQGIRGERGETGADGNGIASVVYNADYSLTLVFDNGERFTTPPIRGERGPAGADGRDGTNGRDGADGVTPSLSVGTVTTLPSTEDAYVTRTGTDENPVFNFGIPQGPKGEQGEVSLDELSALLPTDTASGSIASFPDGTDLFSALSVKAQIEPIQSGSGTPSPDNVRPISGHTEVETEVCGKNLFSLKPYSEWETVGAYRIMRTEFPEGERLSVSFKDKDTSVDVSNISFGFVAREYTSGALVNSQYVWNMNDGVVSTTKKTNTPENNDSSIYLMDFIVYPRLERAYNALFARYDIQIEVGSTPTTYESYNGQSYTTTLGRTVYGGTLDVVSGELVVDRAMVTLDGTESGWSAYGTDSTFWIFIDGKKTGWQTSKCNEFNNVNYAWALSDYGVYCDYTSDNRCYFRQPNASIVTLADFKTWLSQSPIQLCYEFATPQTYQLDPQTIDLLLGDNNVWTDCGSVEVTYKADVGLYIDKKLGTSGTRTLSMTRTLAKSEDTDDTKTVQLAED